MALIKCPECGNQISDKATICPNCGINVQKVLSEIREEQQRQKKKQRKHIFVALIFVIIATAISVLAYLYYIDALNSIPSQYREQSKVILDQYESAIRVGDLDNGIRYFDALKNRGLTKRQSRRFEETKKTMIELRLKRLENQLAMIQSDYNGQVDQIMKLAKAEMDFLGTYPLDASQTERLFLAADRYVELQLRYIEKTLALYKADMRVSSYFERIDRIAQDLQGMELSSSQKVRLEEAVKEAESIKKEAAENRKKQKDAEAIAFIEQFYSYALGENATGWTDAILKQYLGPEVLNFLSEDYGEIIVEPLLYCSPSGDYDLVSYTKAVVMPDGRYRKNFTTKYWGDPSIKNKGSIFYTVEEINGYMLITKIELVSCDD